MLMTIRHFFLVLWNDAFRRGRWDLIWEDIQDLFSR